MPNYAGSKRTHFCQRWRSRRTRRRQVRRTGDCERGQAFSRRDFGCLSKGVCGVGISFEMKSSRKGKGSEEEERERGERQGGGNLSPSHGAPRTWRPFAVWCTNNHVAADGFVRIAGETNGTRYAYELAWTAANKEANVRKVDIDISFISQTGNTEHEEDSTRRASSARRVSMQHMRSKGDETRSLRSRKFLSRRNDGR